jgi:hypothetical protein
MSNKRSAGQGGRSGGAATGGHQGGSKPEYSPGDDRSNVKNDNNPAYEADQANRVKQGGAG